jgi:hypothetical protein
MIPKLSTIILSCTLLCGPAFSQQPDKTKHSLLKRAFAVAACSAQAADFATTAAGASRFSEGNGLMANSNGRPALARIGLVKAGLCGVNVFIATRRSIPAPIVVALSVPTIAVGSGAAIHNLRKMRDK